MAVGVRDFLLPIYLLLRCASPYRISENKASASSKDTHTQGSWTPSGGEVSVTSEATLTIPRVSGLPGSHWVSLSQPLQ